MSMTDFETRLAILAQDARRAAFTSQSTDWRIIVSHLESAQKALDSAKRQG